MAIQNIFEPILVTPIYELLKFLTVTTGNFGIAIILLTLIIRSLLSPLSLPTIKSQKKIRDIKPELDKLKKLHKDDKAKLQVAQMELYKKHNINVMSGCLPQILQLVILIALYGVLQSFVGKATAEGFTINTAFLGLDLSKPDPTRIIPILAAVSQLVMSIMLLPGKEKHDLIPDDVKGKKLKEANKKEAGEQEMAESMQRQMVFMMPLMTGWIALSFPAGLGVYWIVTTVFTIAQQWVVAGPGGLLDVVYSIKSRLGGVSKR
jgi:YidC/Oxa1 family membrane protein insertase